MPYVRYVYPLPCCAESVGRARTWVRIVLTVYGAEDQIDTACLIMSELATNATRRSTGAAMIGIVCETDCSGTLVLGVIDGGSGHPVMVDAAEDDESGRGIALVDALSDEWGCEPYGGGGKLVYARLKLTQACGVPASRACA